MLVFVTSQQEPASQKRHTPHFHNHVIRLIHEQGEGIGNGHQTSTLHIDANTSVLNQELVVIKENL